MAALAQYLETNREQAYAFATANTKCNEQGRPIMSSDDEWVDEREWDELFQELLQKIGELYIQFMDGVLPAFSGQKMSPY